MPGGEEIRSIADVAQPRQPLYAVRRHQRLGRPCSILISLATTRARAWGVALADRPRTTPCPTRAPTGRRYTTATGDTPASNRARPTPTDRCPDQPCGQRRVE